LAEAILPATVAKEPGHRGEYGVTVKTIAQGMLGISGEPVVTNSCVYFISHARLWVQRAPGIPCALCFSRVVCTTTRTHERREVHCLALRNISPLAKAFPTGQEIGWEIRNASGERI
jgi:hypothetical protein